MVDPLPVLVKVYCLAWIAALNDKLSKDRKDILKAILSELQDQEATNFEGSTQREESDDGQLQVSGNSGKRQDGACGGVSYYRVIKAM